MSDSDTNEEGINEGFYGNTIHTSNVQSSVSDVNQFAEPKLPKTMEGKTGQHNMGPTNADIIAMLGKIDLKLNDMDSRLKTLEGLEKKIDNFDKDLKKVWAHMDTVTKDTRDKVDRVENKIDSVGVDIERAKRKILDLEKDNSKLREDMNYVQSQSMRNNLIFGNIPEEPNETPIKCEQLVRDFMSEKLKLSREAVAAMKFERVHRMGHKNTTGRGTTGNGGEERHRSIVCKFSFFGDREQVRGSSKNLRGTPFYVTEQFPPEVAAKRRRLFRRVKEEKQAGKRAWVSYDTLYVDGRPIKDA